MKQRIEEAAQLLSGEQISKRLHNLSVQTSIILPFSKQIHTRSQLFFSSSLRRSMGERLLASMFSNLFGVYEIAYPRLEKRKNTRKPLLCRF